MPTTHRVLPLLVILLLVTAATAGCLRNERDDDDDRPEPATGEVLVSLLGFDSPNGTEEALVNVTVDHIALYDETIDQWVALLVAPRSADLLLTEGFGEITPLARAPILDGNYTALEMIVSAATVQTTNGTTVAEIPEVACYIPISLRDIEDGRLIELQLWVSGPDALQRTPDGYRFQPALIGSAAGAGADDAIVDDVDCQPY